MKALNNLKMSVKLIGAFVFLAVITAVVGIIGIFYIRTIDAADTHLYQNYTVPIMQLDKLGIAFQRIRVNIRDAILIPDAKTSQQKYDTIAQLSDEMDVTAAEYKALIVTQEMQDLFTNYSSAKAAFDPYLEQMIALDKAGKSDEALDILLGDAYQSARTTQDTLTEMMATKVEMAHQIAVDNTAAARQATTIMIIVIVAAVVAAIGFGVVIARSITVPLGQVVQISNALAVGNLVRNLSDEEKDKVRLRKDEIGAVGKALDAVILYLQETGKAADTIANNDLSVKIAPKSDQDELRHSFVKMIQSLNQSVGAVADNACQLAAASHQLAQASDQAGSASSQIATTIQQVAKGTADQTEAVTSTATSMDQMSRVIDGVARGAQEQANAVGKASEVTTQINNAVQIVAGNAQAVTRDSAEAAEAARKGSTIVAHTIQGMQSIKDKVGLSARKVQEMGDRSQQIGMIVETIEDIASQTNLLALNAAIEAARAGEHGKGFAVVADEVRKLAERSSSATKEIGNLIQGIQTTVAEAVDAMKAGESEVEKGVTSAQEAGQSLEDILKAAEAVFAQATQAAEATGEIGVMMSDLVSAVDSVSAVVEENTAATEQMAAGSNEVSRAVESIASVSEENSAAVEEVSASVEEMSAQVEEVNASAQSLADMAVSLQNICAQFILAKNVSEFGSTENHNGNGQRALKAELAISVN